MPSEFVEVAVEVGTVLLYTALAVVVDLAGYAAELEALHQLGDGHLLAAGWFVGMGLLGLFFGTYVLGYERAYPAVRSLLTS